VKSRINLYLPEYQPKLELFTLNLLVLVFSLLVALIIVTRVTLDISGSSTERKLSILESDLQQQTQFARVLTNQLQQRKEDPQLLAVFAGLQLSLQNKERIKEALMEREGLKSASFALMLRELSQQHQQELWLTGINVDEDSMVFDGAVTSPEAVPQWVGRLGETQYFSGKSFDQARLFREDNALYFSLATSRSGKQEHSSGGSR
jgi:hypothetical protein